MATQKLRSWRQLHKNIMWHGILQHWKSNSWSLVRTCWYGIYIKYHMGKYYPSRMSANVVVTLWLSRMDQVNLWVPVTCTWNLQISKFSFPIAERTSLLQDPLRMMLPYHHRLPDQFLQIWVLLFQCLALPILIWEPQVWKKNAILIKIFWCEQLSHCGLTWLYVMQLPQSRGVT